MISCTSVREGLTEYLDAALPDGDRQGIELHLRECAECRQLYCQIRSTISLTAQLPPESPTPGLKAALLQSLHQNNTQAEK